MRCVAGVPSVVLGSLLFKQCVQLRRFGFFLAFESGRSEEKDTPNWSKYEPNPSKVQPGGPLGGAGGVKTAAGGKGTKTTQKTPYF